MRLREFLIITGLINLGYNTDIVNTFFGLWHTASFRKFLASCSVVKVATWSLFFFFHWCLLFQVCHGLDCFSFAYNRMGQFYIIGGNYVSRRPRRLKLKQKEFDRKSFMLQTQALIMKSFKFLHIWCNSFPLPS